MRYRVFIVGPLTADVQDDLSAAGMTLVTEEAYSNVFPTGPFPEPDHHGVLVEARTAVEAVSLVREVVDQRGTYAVFDDAEPA
jgi:hypothetical protein